MPDIGSSSVTASPTAGLLVVLSVTVPVTVAACAIAPANKRLKAKKRALNRIKFISCRNPSIRNPCRSCPDSLIPALYLLQVINLSQKLGRFVLEKASLRNEILLRILARAVFEVQIAQIFVEL